ncbi:predicted protein [Thalassiosira pseudonana CCMP1335]|uniref:L domain-like protein n=1 Tax=Thalassiosira pseudonana TaxID=35128 RepID=B8CGE6_THAPS|nr:predicted protein [Thalassiosira pseudonana CCMP1335]EED87556.1 predicted protein [Thalassiosira pseudonana CCMP1335]
MKTSHLLLAIGTLASTTEAAREKTNLRKSRNVKEDGLSKELNTEDIFFWTRRMNMSLPPSKPTIRPTNNIPATSRPTNNVPVTPQPTEGTFDTPQPTEGIFDTPQPTPFPTVGEIFTSFPTDDSAGGGTFNCPAASFIGCTAIDPSDPQDECDVVGEPCLDGNPGEFCCRDACPRNYCTAKEGIAPITPQPTLKPVTTTPGPTFNCNLEPDERARILTRLIEEVSTVDDLKQDGSPQNKALEWIVNLDLSEVCPSDDAAVQQLIVQRYVMAVFYYSTNGDEWKECSAPNRFTVNTITNADAEYAFKVNVIEFENNNIGGSLPSEMQELSKLRFFALERGSLSGPIPSSFGNLQSLLLLDLDFNALSGELPEEMWSLQQLRQLDLNDNDFTGTLSSSIGQLNELRFFQIDNNNLVGEIPASMGDITTFSLIGLSGNDFTGGMPDSLCSLRPSPLQTLVVDCSIDCAVPDCCTSCVP